MSYTNGLDNPELFFQTLTWSGNDTGTSRAFTLDGSENMQPDFVWTKIRTGWSADHNLFDSVRGAGKNLHSNSSEAEGTNDQYGYVSSFDSDGFTVSNGSSGANPRYYNNENGGTYVAWNWKAGTSFSNDASSTGIGTIDSSGSFNNDSGFSIVSYVGTGSVATIKHGLNSEPYVIMVKSTVGLADHWFIYHKSNGNTGSQFLNLTNGFTSGSNDWNNTTPTSSVFTVGTQNGISKNTATFIAYCFAEKKGYSKFGSYVGNGVASGGGPFIYLGFKPAFFLLKESSNADNWIIMDNKRLGYNPRNDHLFPNLNNAEYASDRLELMSNGVKVIDNDGSINTSGATYVFMAFAESPFVNSNGVPNNAR